MLTKLSFLFSLAIILAPDKVGTAGMVLPTFSICFIIFLKNIFSLRK